MNSGARVPVRDHQIHIAAGGPDRGAIILEHDRFFVLQRVELIGRGPNDQLVTKFRATLNDTHVTGARDIKGVVS